MHRGRSPWSSCGNTEYVWVGGCGCGCECVGVCVGVSVWVSVCVPVSCTVVHMSFDGM